MTVLKGFLVVQLGPGLAAAVCGRLLADVGATVTRIDPDGSTPLAEYLNRGGQTIEAHQALGTAELIVCEGSPAALRRTGRDADALRRINKNAAVVLISPFGQTGPRAEEPATDLTLFFASGIGRMLTGQVDDLDEPPMRPVGQQSAFIGGLAAACAGMHAALVSAGEVRAEGMGAGDTIAEDAAVVDVSIQEALATLAMTELTRAGQSGNSWSRKRVADGNGATVCILPASDGFAAISPREDRQWASWLVAMDSPAWGRQARFATKADRVANWDALHALMADWSRGQTKQSIAQTAQAAHVPSFPLCEPSEHLGSPQLRHRDFFRPATISGQPVQVPGSPFGLVVAPLAKASAPAGETSDPPGQASGRPANAPCLPRAGRRLPLSGIRVLDFSWVIAGPTATRYLAAMGAEVIKVEAPGSGDPARASGLHTVLGQAKQGIVLDLKQPAAIAVAKALAARSDVLVENFATGVMERLGLGAAALRADNPGLIYVSASGLGRSGPESHAVAYGTLLQCYAGFAGLNRHPDVAPRVGMAWLDPMCGLMLAFITAASLWRRQRGDVARVDFSMLEAMLWTMAEPLIAEQTTHAPQDPPEQGSPERGQPKHGQPERGPPEHGPPKHGSPKHGSPERGSVERCAGPDDWLAVEPAQAGLSHGADDVAALHRAGIAAAMLARSADLVASEHLQARGFWDERGLPGLPWRASFGQANGPAPALGGDTDAVLRELLGMATDEVSRLRKAGALGGDYRSVAPVLFAPGPAG